MAGNGKRPAELVPFLVRRELDTLSKADLMELAWSFAKRFSADDDAEAYGAIRHEYVTLCLNRGAKPKTLVGTLMQLAKNSLAVIEESFDITKRLVPESRTPANIARYAEDKATFYEENASYIAYLRELAGDATAGQVT